MEPTPDLTTVFALHDRIRADVDRAVAATESAREDEGVDRLTSLARWIEEFGDELRRHHAAEDTVLLHDVAERVPSVSAIVAELGSERRVVDALVVDWHLAVAALAEPADRREPFEAARRRAIEAASAAPDVLLRQLDIEEEDVLPLFYRHYSAAEYEALQLRAMTARTRRPDPATHTDIHTAGSTHP